MKILALDPGNERTGWVQFHDGEIIAHGIDLNEAVRQYLALVSVECDVLAIENIASYGMPVGEEVFSTCRWIGRFVECWVGTCGNSESSVRLLPRKEIKIHRLRNCEGEGREHPPAVARLDRAAGREEGTGPDLRHPVARMGRARGRGNGKSDVTTETLTGAIHKARAKRKKQTVYGKLAVLADPRTGEEHRAVYFLAAPDVDQIRDRGFKSGDLVRLTVEKAVDPYLNRLVHALGKLVVHSLDDFAHLTAHQALKRLQAESGVHCEPMRCSIVGSDEVVIVNAPISLSFDESNDAEFRAFSRGISQYISKRYWPSTSAEEIEELMEIQAKAESV